VDNWQTASFLQSYDPLLFIVISKAMYIYTSEMLVEAKNTFHKGTANGLTVLGQHSASPTGSAEKLGVFVQLICCC